MTSQAQAHRNVLPPTTHMGHAHLKVSDLPRALAFYQDLLGLKEEGREGNTVWLAARAGGPVLLVLTAIPGARPKPRGTTGLYHIAIRLPTREALANIFRRLLDARWSFQGFSDHKVSEALYLADPDGNGLELCWDRPADRWPRGNGQILMRTDPLDIEDLLQGATPSPLHPESVIGHVHVHVRDLDEAEAFYHRTLGLDVTLREYPGARFFAAGGYHHHVGTNIWAGQGAPPPPPEAVGLAYMTLVVPDAGHVARLAQQAEAADYLHYRNEQGFLGVDDAGNAVWVTAQDIPENAGRLLKATQTP